MGSNGATFQVSRDMAVYTLMHLQTNPFTACLFGKDTRRQNCLFTSDSELYTEICLSDVPFIECIIKWKRRYN